MSKPLSGQIAILVLFYNKLEQTKECIDSFLPCGESIYILNNGSKAVCFSTLQEEYKSYKQVHFLDAGLNLGPAGGRNYLISKTTQPWLFFVDNDIKIKSGSIWLNFFKDFINENKNAEIICPRIFNVHENAFMDRLCLELRNNILEVKATKSFITNYFPEGGVIVNKRVFQKYGLYDFNMFAFEGYEFSLRAILSSFGQLQVFYFNKIELIHDHRLQNELADIKSVKERYNQKKHFQSLKYLEDKHGVVFSHDWEWWVSKQISFMTPKSKVKKFIKKIAIKIFYSN
jgi:GT2 family glycosyltransferase